MNLCVYLWVFSSNTLPDMLQKLALRNFEFQINTNTWNRAQDLAHSGSVRALQEVERNFWVAKVHDGDEAYESEVIITPTRIKAYACGCWTEQRRLMCSHIAATLLKLRQYLDQKAEEKARQLEAEQAPAEKSRIAVADVLEEATLESLRAFVRMYARRDRDFNLALKTWFAGSLTTAGENPYGLVLDSVLPKTAQTSALREPDYKRLRRTISDLQDQLLTARNDGNMRSAYLLSSALFQRITPLLRHAEEPRKGALMRDVQAAYKELAGLFSQSAMAFELRDAAWQVLLEGAKQPGLPTDIRRELVRFLAATARDQARFDTIAAAYFADNQEDANTGVLYLYVAALAVRGMEAGVSKILADRFDHAGTQPAQAQAARLAVLELYYLNYDAAATLGVRWLLDQGGLPAAIRREMEDLLMHLAERSGDPRKIRALLIQRYVEQGRLTYYERLRALAADNWPTTLQELIEALQATHKTEQLAAVLATEGDTKALAQWLAQSDDMAVLERYEHLLEPDFLVQRYTRHLIGFLTDHMGEPALAHVRAVLGGLLRRGRSQVVPQVFRQLTLAYPDREGLGELLSELLRNPK
jgi:hypothetical protein